jgi:hypothetical protein
MGAAWKFWRTDAAGAIVVLPCFKPPLPARACVLVLVPAAASHPPPNLLLSVFNHF